MKRFALVILLFVLPATVSGQSLISMDPDSALQGQNLTTTITSTGFYFTQGSGPTAWGNFYMTNSGTWIYPNWVNIIDDDHFDANWTIPTNAAPGNYLVRYEHYDPWNPWGFPLYADVPGGFTVVSCPGPPATITANGPTTICAPGTVLLSANTGTGLTYQWYRYSSPITGATSSTYTASLGGPYYVQVTNQGGCITNSNTITVTANTSPDATINTYTPRTFCYGGSVVIYATYGLNITFQWRKNGVNISGATSQTYSASTTGNFDVIVTNNSTGCSKTSAVVTVTVLPLPTATVTATGSTTFCAGSGVTLSANSGTGLTYIWYKYSNPIPSATQQTYFAGTSGNYKVQVTNSNGCSRKSNAILVTSIPLPPASVTASGPTSFCAGDSVVLTANSGTGLTYQWKRYSAIINGATSPSYTVKNAGKYKVLVTNSSGCSRASNSITVTVPCREDQNMDLSNSQEFLFDAITKSLVIRGYVPGILEIMSADGRRVYQTKLTGNEDVELNTLASGLYIAVFRSQESEPLLIKFYHPGD